mmetsp:Transcript_3914/g.9491  ORF Transcript_3914/g.9491 Transcript_3914/m.9491 type:complete len:89 (+) Transcript_3914:3684-3950(+)
MHWENELNIEWSTKALQVAASVDPRHKHLETDEIHNKVKDYLDGLGPVDRKFVSPGEIHRMLMTELDPPTLPNTHDGRLIGTFDSVEE